jgi:DNA-binding PadR family transcriptional regulator
MEASVKRERSISMRSSVNWTVLGLVIEEASYGFRLWKRFEEMYGDLLMSACQSNIYAALDALRVRGFIEEVEGSRVPPGGRRQPKPYYRVTPEGLEAYEGWLMEQAREHHRHLRQIARQLGTLEQRPQAALEMLARYEQACLDDKAGAIPTISEFPVRVVPGLGDRLASSYSRSVVAATLGWIEHARQEFVALTDSRTG